MAMPATTPPLRSELGTHGPRLRDVLSEPAHPKGARTALVSAAHIHLDDAASKQRQPFSTKGRVPVATTIVLFTIVGALIAFIAIAN